MGLTPSDDGAPAMRDVKVERNYKLGRILAKTLLWSLGFIVFGFLWVWLYTIYISYLNGLEVGAGQ
jgi:polyferredoxin